MRINKHIVGFLGVFLLIGSSLFAWSLLVDNTAYGWSCSGASDIDMGNDDNCVAKSYKECNSKPGHPDICNSQTDYEKFIHDCHAVNNVNDGYCANGLNACLDTLLDTSKCDTSMASRIGNECGHGSAGSNIPFAMGSGGGRVTANSSNDNQCDPIALANSATIDSLEAQGDAAVKACDGSDNYAKCKQAAKEANLECAKRAGLSTDGDSRNTGDLIDHMGNVSYSNGPNSDYVAMRNNMSKDEYNKCIQEQLREKAPDDSRAFCEAAGGVYSDKDYKDASGQTGNDVKKGCHNKYSDLTTPEACAAAGSDNRNTGVWAQEPGKTGNDGWGCYDPSEVCKEDSGYTINDRAPCKEAPKTPADPNDTTPNTTVNKHAKEDFETCGTASVNLLSCSEKDCPGSNGPFSGMQVLGCVLRIGLQALTVLVGIGAVGGIAYSSFRYASASDNAGAVTEAKGRIRDIVIGLIVYVFLLAVVQWLVPGLVMDTGTSSSGTPATQASP